jgi:hypothetical protein
MEGKGPRPASLQGLEQGGSMPAAQMGGIPIPPTAGRGSQFFRHRGNITVLGGNEHQARCTHHRFRPGIGSRPPRQAPGNVFTSLGMAVAQPDNRESGTFQQHRQGAADPATADNRQWPGGAIELMYLLRLLYHHISMLPCFAVPRQDSAALIPEHFQPGGKIHAVTVILDNPRKEDYHKRRDEAIRASHRSPGCG